MSCGFTSFNYSSLNSFNSCQYNAGGVKRVWISAFNSSAKNNLNISNQQVNSINNVPLQWFELHLTRTTTKPTENLLSNGNYEQIFDFIINRMQPNRRLTINNIVKGKWFIIYQDMNNYYWLLGLQNGLITKTYSSTADVYQGGNGYSFSLRTEQIDMIIGVNENYINNSVDVALDCSLSYTEDALTSTYYIYEFEDCLVEEHPDSNL